MFFSQSNRIFVRLSNQNPCAMIDTPVKHEEKRYTFEEYLLMEEKAEYKSEFRGGKIVAMSGGTLNHSAIISNTNAALHHSLKKKGSKCRVMESNLNVRIEADDTSVYPDVMVFCGKPEFWKGRKDVILNPTLVVEVLSEFTEDYDRGSKFAKYRSIPSFKEYVVISQNEPVIETWYRLEENVWRISRYEGPDATIKLHSLDCEISLTDIFYQIEMEE
jgi:Uma2 family endonuclease